MHLCISIHYSQHISVCRFQSYLRGCFKQLLESNARLVHAKHGPLSFEICSWLHSSHWEEPEVLPCTLMSKNTLHVWDQQIGSFVLLVYVMFNNGAGSLESPDVFTGQWPCTLHDFCPHLAACVVLPCPEWTDINHFSINKQFRQDRFWFVRLQFLSRLWVWCPGMWYFSSHVKPMSPQPGIIKHGPVSLPGKLTFHFHSRASRSAPAEPYCSTPITPGATAAAWERRLGLSICCSSQWPTYDLGACRIVIQS